MESLRIVYQGHTHNKNREINIILYFHNEFKGTKILQNDFENLIGKGEYRVNAFVVHRL